MYFSVEQCSCVCDFGVHTLVSENVHVEELILFTGCTCDTFVLISVISKKSDYLFTQLLVGSHAA